MIERTPTSIMMTYQVPARDMETLLKQDLEKLTAMRNKQPWFTEAQKEELAEVHSWIRNRTIPQEIDTQGCIMCVKGITANNLKDKDEDHGEEDATKATEQSTTQQFPCLLSLCDSGENTSNSET
ncbi:unnamed protein product [Ranitomeya imitator]|uniref:Period circadian-like C-terminal domain-containing protein n=2 Tax=Ranitomeya imitator TaxID=111125 RepID=A0ABN9M8I8_9NEOB|nr:unnamed protein product [Ranitomeya imitator]